MHDGNISFICRSAKIRLDAGFFLTSFPRSVTPNHMIFMEKDLVGYARAVTDRIDNLTWLKALEKYDIIHKPL